MPNMTEPKGPRLTQNFVKNMAAALGEHLLSRRPTFREVTAAMRNVPGIDATYKMIRSLGTPQDAAVQLHREGGFPSVRSALRFLSVLYVAVHAPLRYFTLGREQERRQSQERDRRTWQNRDRGL